jgi:hypothetical protein
MEAPLAKGRPCPDAKTRTFYVQLLGFLAADALWEQEGQRLGPLPG